MPRLCGRLPQAYRGFLKEALAFPLQTGQWQLRLQYSRGNLFLAYYGFAWSIDGEGWGGQGKARLRTLPVHWPSEVASKKAGGEVELDMRLLQCKLAVV